MTARNCPIFPSRRFLRAALPAAACLTASTALAAPPSALIARGRYLATAGDCAACHTAPGARPFAGGYNVKTPFGTIPTPNITPDKTSGIGWMTEADFYHVMHDGIGYHGEYLYPAMPFPWYTHVSRADDDAIFAYLKTQAPVTTPARAPHLAFPFNPREGLVAWRAAFFSPGHFTPDPHQSAAVNRGAYLVQGLGHCGACHDANMLAGDSKFAGKLHGGGIDGWYAPSLIPGSSGLADWSVPQLVGFFRHGHAPGSGVVLGPMAQVVHESLSHLSTTDLTDIALYLKSLPAGHGAPPAPVTTAAANDTGANDTGASDAGANLYLSHCAFCHGQHGQGMPGLIPALAGNGAVTAGGPQNVISIVLRGHLAQAGYGPMPAVGAGLSDAQIAAIANYVRASWGNHAPATAGPGLVGPLREAANTMLADPNRSCAPIANPALNAALAPGSAAAQALASLTTDHILGPLDTTLADLKKAAPQATDAERVNAITAAYCPIVAAAHLSQSQAATRLGNIAMLSWGQLHQPGGRN